MKWANLSQCSLKICEKHSSYWCLYIRGKNENIKVFRYLVNMENLEWPGKGVKMLGINVFLFLNSELLLIFNWIYSEFQKFLVWEGIVILLPGWSIGMELHHLLYCLNDKNKLLNALHFPYRVLLRVDNEVREG